eukprot:3678031-Rhodomonas_salina.2
MKHAGLPMPDQTQAPTSIVNFVPQRRCKAFDFAVTCVRALPPLGVLQHCLVRALRKRFHLVAPYTTSVPATAQPYKTLLPTPYKTSVPVVPAEQRSHHVEGLHGLGRVLPAPLPLDLGAQPLLQHRVQQLPLLHRRRNQVLRKRASVKEFAAQAHKDALATSATMLSLSFSSLMAFVLVPSSSAVLVAASEGSVPGIGEKAEGGAYQDVIVLMQSSMFPLELRITSLRA